MTDSIEKIKVLVLGDSGVGKTSLVNLIANNNNKTSSWTVGCNLEVIYHQSPEHSEFIELWDVGGSLVHANSRSVFLGGSYHGIVLVHDLTNSKSYTNMIRWAVEFARQGDHPNKRLTREGESNLLKSIDIPKLIVGTKQDYLWSRSRYTVDRSGMMSHLNAQFISVNCLDHLQFKSSYQEQQISNFFDQVIKHKKNASNRFNKPFRNTVETPSSTSSGLFSSLDLGFSF